MGKTLSFLIAGVPLLWPLLRGPTRRFWERTAVGWDERIQPDSPEHLQTLAAACDRLADPPRRILELGTGTGSGALMLARRFPEASVDAVDISEPMVRAAEAKLPAALRSRVRFSVGDSARLPYEDGAFDLVAQLNVPVYFDELARVVGPGGSVIVASSLGPPTPYYTPHRILRRKFGRRGFEVVESGSAGGGTFWLARRRPA